MKISTFELILIQGERDPVSVFYMWISSFPSSVFEKADFSPFVFGSFVKDQLAVDAWVYVWVFYSDPLVYLSVFVLIPYHFYCNGSSLKPAL
jgi:hypothetical protein